MFGCAVLLGACVSLVALAQDVGPQFDRGSARHTLDVRGYRIDLELDPAAHTMTATAVVTFTAPESADTVTFGLHPALKITSITDDAGAVLTGERTTDGNVRIVPATAPGEKPLHWTFVYSGKITGSEDGPVEGLKLAAIGDPITYLLYPARWFPTTGYLTDRFTMELNVRVPQGERVIASGSTGVKQIALEDGKPGTEYDFNWTKPGFPGTVVAGRFVDPATANSAANVKAYTTVAHQGQANGVAEIAAREMDFFTTTFGQPESGRMNVVELPSDTLPAFWAPELAVIMGAHLTDSAGTRLMANTLAHQWWGSEVSPASLNDAWITNGMARYAELMYVENESGRTALERAVNDIAAGAIAYDTTPLSAAGRLGAFAPQFQSMTLEKGAMVFHMLRWEVGDATFKQILRGALSQYTDKSIRGAQLEKVAEQVSQKNLTPFFSQWIDGTGEPKF
jgi:aminopeptidase N